MIIDDEISAYRQARGVAAVAGDIRDKLLHSVVYDAKEQHLGIRETARLLGIPKSTVAREWHRMPRAADPPADGSEEAYMTVAEFVYRDTPGLWDGHCPWRWTRNGDGTLTISLVPLGTVHIDVPGTDPEPRS